MELKLENNRIKLEKITINVKPLTRSIVDEFLSEMIMMESSLPPIPKAFAKISDDNAKFTDKENHEIQKYSEVYIARLLKYGKFIRDHLIQSVTSNETGQDARHNDDFLEDEDMMNREEYMALLNLLKQYGMRQLDTKKK